MSETTLPVIFRPPDVADLVFITTAWLQTFSGSEFAREIRNCEILGFYADTLEPNRPSPSVYYGLHRPYISKLLTYCTTIVAAFEDDPQLIVGFIVGDTAKRRLHYVCVKPQYQRQGVGKRLFDAITKTAGGCWHASAAVLDMCEKVSWLRGTL